MDDMISRQAAIDAIDKIFPADPMRNDYTQGITCGAALAEEYIKQLPSAQPEWHESPKNALYIRKADAIEICMEQIESPINTYFEKGTAEIIKEKITELPSAQPERTCVNCGRTVNNGGWYADGGTRCPIEEHYALPKDGYCHLWEKRNVTDDDYPERRTDE